MKGSDHHGADGNLARFRKAVTRHLGLQFDESRLGVVNDVFERRVAQLGTSPAVYLHGLEGAGGQREATAALAPELTVGETYFFRNNEQFRVLTDIVVPAYLRGGGGGGVIIGAGAKLRILSAGCSSGEEAYTIAIALHESGFALTGADILGVDINPASLERARRARYSSWSLRATSADIEQRWFSAEGRHTVLRASALTGVSFEERNLASDKVLWPPNSLDVVFCRNVLMYFAPEQARALVARFARALRPGGYLFLGHAETLRGLSDAFHLRHTHDTFYYQLKEDAAAASSVPIPPEQAAAAAAHAAAGAASTAIDDPVIVDGGWIETIRAASDRVSALASGLSPAAPPQPASPRRAAAAAAAAPRRTGPSWNLAPGDLAPAIEMLKAERFADALTLVRQLPPASKHDPAVLLLTAALLALSGQPEAAEEICRELLRVDDLNASAYYVLALSREAQGDRDGAAENDRTAIHLDAAFAMPRLHLGLLLRRLGDRDAARRELAEAATLLKHEDPFRLLLFGGGFTGDALLAFCETALRDNGATP